LTAALKDHLDGYCKQFQQKQLGPVVEKAAHLLYTAHCKLMDEYFYKASVFFTQLRPEGVFPVRKGKAHTD